MVPQRIGNGEYVFPQLQGGVDPDASGVGLRSHFIRLIKGKPYGGFRARVCMPSSVLSSLVLSPQCWRVGEICWRRGQSGCPFMPYLRLSSLSITKVLWLVSHSQVVSISHSPWLIAAAHRGVAGFKAPAVVEIEDEDTGVDEDEQQEEEEDDDEAIALGAALVV